MSVWQHFFFITIITSLIFLNYMYWFKNWGEKRWEALHDKWPYSFGAYEGKEHFISRVKWALFSGLLLTITLYIIALIVVVKFNL